MSFVRHCCKKYYTALHLSFFKVNLWKELYVKKYVPEHEIREIAVILQQKLALFYKIIFKLALP